eukprot:scaffold9864_cov66-Skeletonema_marinoi.AAC.1
MPMLSFESAAEAAPATYGCSRNSKESTISMELSSSLSSSSGGASLFSDESSVNSMISLLLSTALISGHQGCVPNNNDEMPLSCCRRDSIMHENPSSHAHDVLSSDENSLNPHSPPIDSAARDRRGNVGRQGRESQCIRDVVEEFLLERPPLEWNTSAPSYDLLACLLLAG